VFQEDSYISMDYGQHCGMVMKRNKLGLARRDVELDEKNALAAELEDFIAAVQQTRATGVLQKTRVSGTDGLKALKLAVAIEEEARRYNKQYGFEFPTWSPDELV
jgi:predicted dehydrogenase